MKPGSIFKTMLQKTFMMATKRMVNKMVDMEYEAGKIEAKIKKFVSNVLHLFSSSRNR